MVKTDALGVSSPHPWDIQPGETPDAYNYFRAWRDSAYPDGPLGGFRPRPALAKYAEQIGSTPSAMYHASTRGLWFSRACAYDLSLDQARQAADMTAIERMSARHLQAFEELSQIVALERAKQLERSSDPSAPAMSPRDILALQDSLIKNERLAHGQVTERTDHTGRVDLLGWSMDDLQRQRELLEKNST